MGIGASVNRSVRPVRPVRSAQPAAAVRRTRPGVDLILVLVVAVLGIFGLLMQYSAGTDYSLLTYGSPYTIFIKQVIFMLLGAGLAYGLSLLDYHRWSKAAIYLMGITIILLIAVLVNNEVRNNAVRTFFGGSVQPSELAKVAIVIYLSIWLFSKRDVLHELKLGLIPLAVILGFIAGLIVRQPDLSAAVTIFILGILLFFLAGGEIWQILAFSVVALLVGYVVIKFFNNSGTSRIDSFLAGLKDPLNYSDHVLWSLESIYKGRLFGVGIGQATTKLIGLPVAATDSIFAVIVEELGLVGAIGLIGLYAALAWRGFKIASTAPDTLGSLMAAGLTSWIIIEAGINMAVMVGLMPFAGNALPFVSSGGSNLLSVMAAIGILLNISRRSGQPAAAIPGGEGKTYSASLDLRRRDRRRSVSRSRRPASPAK